MNRTERLHAIHEELRRSGSTGATAATLATALEVSVRTIKRDVTALQEAGAPIWAQPGPGGGYTMSDAANLPAINFNASQIVAIAVALAAMPPGSPFGADGRTAARKLRDALGEVEHVAAHELARRVWVDRSHRDDTDTTSRRVLRAVEAALLDRRAISLAYRSAVEVITQRIVEPVVVAWTEERWYLVAHCRLRDDIRWFRLDRIERATITSERYRPRSVHAIGAPPASATHVDGERS